MRVCRKCFGLYAPDQMTCPKDGTPTQNHVDVLVGQQLGAYVVRSLIGEGGMGVVYAGEHPALGKRIALKVLRPELSLRDDIVERFVQEARAVNTIGHANIVNIYDFGRTPYGSFYFVMEFLDGQTIRALLDAGGPLPLERARMVVLGVGAALSAAHAKGFIHRDIKPENIMITSRAGQEQVKLLDFGIVKLLSQQSRRQTHTGSALGTPQYMCPEQLEESPIDHRADIFALGAVTYEMLTGMVPFPGRSHAEVRQLQLTRAPAPPSVARSESRLSRAMDGAVLWALSLDPANRCKRMEDFVSAFQAGYERTLVEQSAPRPEGTQLLRSTKVVVWGAILAVVAAAGGVGGYLVLRRPPPSPQIKADARAPGTAQAGPYSEAAAFAAARVQVVEALRSTDLERRRKVIDDLREAGRPVMLPQLRAALRAGNDPDIQKRAAQTLAELGDKKAIPTLRELLEGSIGFKALDMSAALAQLGDAAGLVRLRQFASSRQELERTTALHALGKIGDKKATGWKELIGSQRLVVPQLRIRALGYLAFVGDAAARRDLEKLLSEGDWSVRVAAAEAISATDAEEALEVFAAALNHAPPRERLRAAQQLANFGDSRSAEALVQFLRSANPEERRLSALALGRLDLPGARKHVAEALRDSSPDVALAAAVALVRP